MEKCTVEKLSGLLEYRPATSDDYCSAESWAQVRADLRHNCTNYDDLWGELALTCVEFWESGNVEYCNSVCDEGEPCPIKEKVYNDLKVEANDLARKALQEQVGD